VSADTKRTPLVAVIDDEEDITTYLELALADVGYRVVTCNQPSGALDMLRQERPDLICLDLVMPERAGGSLYVALRRDSVLKEVPVLILSGLGARQETLDAIVAAAAVPPPDGCVDKPLDGDELIARIGALLEAPPRTEPDDDGAASGSAVADREPTDTDGACTRGDAS
jgi:DNA-binding response OmpR family regulator